MNRAWLLASMMVAAPVLAGPTEAQRYIDSQGVEVIHNRSTVPRDAQSALPLKTVKGSAAAMRPTSGIVAADARLDPKIRVSTDEQAVRDNDRAAILNQELMAEAAAYESKWKALNSGGTTGKLSDAELTRLKESMYGHEQNIRSLNAELRRMQARR